MRLPIDYARLNEWPEGFTADAGRSYEIVEGGDRTGPLDGGALASGLPLRIEPGAVRLMRVCRTD